MIFFLTYCIIFVVHCLSFDGPQLFANNQLSNEDVKVNMNSKDTIRLACRFSGTIQWILPDNTEYKDYSNPMLDGRCNIETLENQSILTIKDLGYTDTGLYKCVSHKDSNGSKDESTSSTRIEIGAYVFVKDDNPNHLFMHFIGNTITVYKDRESYLNCKITDTNAKVDLFINNEAKTDFEYDKQKGFRVPAGSLEHLRNLHEMECVATYPSTNTRDSIITLLLMIERKPNTFIVNIYPDNADKLFNLNSQLNLHCNVANYDLAECTWSYPPASNILVNEKTHSILLDSVNVTALSPLRIALLSMGIRILTIIVVALLIVLFVMRSNYKKQVKRLHVLYYSLRKDADVEDKVNLLIPINEQPENFPFKREFDMPKNSLNMDLAREIARGAFGVVYTVPLKAANNPIVIAKIVKRISFELHDQLISEVKIMIYIGDHVNVLSLIGAITTQLAKGILLIVTEYCEKGSLLKLVEKMRERFNHEYTPESRRDQRRSAARPRNANGYWIPQSFNTNTHRFHTVQHDFDEELCTADLLCFLYQIANGMVFLSSRKIIHRDLAARNIFLTRNNFVRIADFGLSRQGETYRIKKSLKMPLPVAQLAPEALLYNQFSEKSDIWSFGILMFEIFSLGEKPYPTRDFNQQFLDDLKNGLHPNNPQYSSIEMNKLMEKCWELKVSNRPDHVECRSYIQDQLESHCLVCYNNLNIALKDDANKPDFSRLREEFGKNQSFGYEVPKSAMKCVKEKEHFSSRKKRQWQSVTQRHEFNIL